MNIVVTQLGRVVGEQQTPPAKLVVAGNDSLETFEFSGTPTSIGILVDTVENRILLVDPLLADSMFTQTLLPGRKVC